MAASSVLERSREVAEKVTEAVVGEEKLGRELRSGFRGLPFRVFGSGSI